MYQVEIKIECDDPKDIEKHLRHMAREIQRAVRKNPDAGRYALVDNNCYGTHIFDAKVVE